MKHRTFDQAFKKLFRSEVQALKRAINSRTPAQNEAGAKNLAAYRASHAGSPRLKSGVHAFLRTGRVPVGVPGGVELVKYVEEMLAEMMRDRGVTRADLSAEQCGILNNQRRCLVAIGLLNGFFFKAKTFSPDDDQLIRNLYARARRNFDKFQRGERIFDRILSKFASFVHDSIRAA